MPDAQTAVPITDRVTFSIVETVDGLARLEADWNGLFERAGQPQQVFQTFAFARLWARFYLDDHTRLAVLTARTGDGRLVMVWPLVLETACGVTILSFLGAPVAQYGDLLIEDRPDRVEIMRAAYAHLREALRPDCLRLRKVRADAVIMPLIAGLGSLESAHEEAPLITLGAVGETATFEDRQSGKAKKNRRRLMRRLEEQGAVGFSVHTGSGEAGRLAAEALEIKRRWLADRGLYSKAFGDERLDKLLTAAAADPTGGTGCTVLALTLDNRAIAPLIGFACKGRLIAHMIAYDLAHEKAGAGVLALEAALRHCLSQGFDSVDMLAPRADYKMDWTDATVAVCDHAVPLTLKGRAFVSAWDGFIKPRAKAALASMPLAIRRHTSPATPAA